MPPSTTAARFFRAFHHYSVLGQRHSAKQNCIRHYSNAQHSSISNAATQLKSIMRCVPQPIVVISSRHPDRSPEHCGMTVSTFTTVSVQPESFVSLSIKRPSYTLDAIETSGAFAVHFLRDTDMAAKLAHTFSHNSGPFFAGDDPDLAADFGVKLSNSSYPVPLIHDKGHGSPEASIYAHMICKFLPQKSITLGDHMVLFAQPVSFETQEVNARGLSYCHGEYLTHGVKR